MTKKRDEKAAQTGYMKEADDAEVKPDPDALAGLEKPKLPEVDLTHEASIVAVTPPEGVPEDVAKSDEYKRANAKFG